MENTIHLLVTTQGGTVMDKQVNYVMLPFEDGGIGILKDHAPVIGSLAEGIIEYKEDETKGYVAVTGGAAGVENNDITVLARTAEIAENIDLARAIAAEKRAREYLASKEEGINIMRAQASLARSLVRQKAYALSQD